MNQFIVGTWHNNGGNRRHFYGRLNAAKFDQVIDISVININVMPRENIHHKSRMNKINF